MNEKQAEFTKLAFELIGQHLETLRQKNYQLPTDDEIREAVGACVNSRNGRWRKSKPKNNKIAELLFDLVKFHRGSGSLWGFPWFADPVEREKWDTVALLLLGNKSNAVNSWKRALGK